VFGNVGRSRCGEDAEDAEKVCPIVRIQSHVVGAEAQQGDEDEVDPKRGINAKALAPCLFQNVLIPIDVRASDEESADDEDIGTPGNRSR
jgi:hypothetical protein